MTVQITFESGYDKVFRGVINVIPRENLVCVCMDGLTECYPLRSISKIVMQETDNAQVTQ